MPAARDPDLCFREMQSAARYEARDLDWQYCRGDAGKLADLADKAELKLNSHDEGPAFAALVVAELRLRAAARLSPARQVRP